MDRTSFRDRSYWTQQKSPGVPTPTCGMYHGTSKERRPNRRVRRTGSKERTKEEGRGWMGSITLLPVRSESPTLSDPRRSGPRPRVSWGTKRTSRQVSSAVGRVGLPVPPPAVSLLAVGQEAPDANDDTRPPGTGRVPTPPDHPWSPDPRTVPGLLLSTSSLTGTGGRDSPPLEERGFLGRRNY